MAVPGPTAKSSEQLLTVDRSARGSMKTAAKCVSACESQDYQMHRPVERTLRRRYYPVMSPLPDECLLTNSIHPLVRPAGAGRRNYGGFSDDPSAAPPYGGSLTSSAHWQTGGGALGCSPWRLSAPYKSCLYVLLACNWGELSGGPSLSRLLDRTLSREMEIGLLLLLLSVHNHYRHHRLGVEGQPYGVPLRGLATPRDLPGRT